FLASELQVGEPAQRVGEPVLERAVGVVAGALVGDGAVGDRAIAAAVGFAEAVLGQVRRALVESAQRGAAIGRRDVDVLVPVVDLGDQARQAATFCRRVQGRV